MKPSLTFSELKILLKQIATQKCAVLITEASKTNCRCNEHHVKKKTPKKTKTKPRHSSELGTAREPWFSFQHESQRLHFHSVCDDDQKEILFLSFPTSQHRKTACGLREHVTFNMGKNIAQCIIILAL